VAILTGNNGPSLSEISNTAVALHRQHFGRGPGSAKSYLTEDLLVCVLTGVFTVFERDLIAIGSGDQVTATRALHHAAVEAEYRARMEPVVGREVVTFLSAVDIEEDLAVNVFMLGAAVEVTPGTRSPESR
jgi:uncharacterized protein YbcI